MSPLTPTQQLNVIVEFRRPITLEPRLPCLCSCTNVRCPLHDQ